MWVINNFQFFVETRCCNVGVCRDPFDCWSFQRRIFLVLYSYFAYILGKTFAIRISIITERFCMVVSWSSYPLFINILYLGLLMLEQCICKICFEIDIDRLGGILIWFYSCMALYLEHYFLLISCCVNW